MRAISIVAGRAYPLGRPNIDTDVIIPARFLKTIARRGLGEGAFETVREEPGNVFDDPRFSGAPILIAGANFGCGSSREHAAWAMADIGVCAVIAPSFSDIFSGNAYKNGILTVAMPQKHVEHLLEVAAQFPIAIDLPSQTVTTPGGDCYRFEIDTFRKECLLNGLDEIETTLAFDADITAYEGAARLRSPWLEGLAGEG